MSFTAYVSLERFTLNDAPFVEAALVEAFCDVLGPPSRVIDPTPPAPVGHRNNQIHMYDELGLYLNEHHYTYTVCSVTFVLWPEEAPFQPVRPFGGQLTLGDLRVAPGISESEILDCSIPFRQFLGGSWSAAGGDLWIGFDSIGRKGRSGRRGRKRLVTTLSVCLRHDPWDARYRPA